MRLPGLDQIMQARITVKANVEAPNKAPTARSSESSVPEATTVVIMSVAPLLKANKVAPAIASVSFIYPAIFPIALDIYPSETYSNNLI
jgi:hypothetical protein